MKYKLIDSVTKVETICDKVTIDGFDYYVSDDKPKLGEFYIDDANQIRQGLTDDEEYWDRRSGYKIITSTTNPNIDIPKILSNDILIERLANKLTAHLTFPEERREGIIFGYNKSQETHPNSDEDMIEFVEWSQISQWNFNGSTKTWWSVLYINLFPTTRELIQLWKEQQPKIGYYE